MRASGDLSYRMGNASASLRRQGLHWPADVLDEAEESLAAQENEIDALLRRAESAEAMLADTEGFPDRLPEDIRPTRCHGLNPCPDRPRRRLRRFTDSPWRCPQCSRWWVTVGEEHSSISVTWTTWTWVRAEAKR